MQGIDLSNHYFTSVSSSVKAILDPVMSSNNLNFFRYLRLYNDGTRVHLCSDSDWTNHFYREGLYKIAWYDRYVPSHHLSSRSIWDEKVLTSDNIVGIHSRTIFDINHGFSVVRPNVDYCEVFDFATTEANIAVNDIYMRSPGTIDEIIFLFKSQARHIIEKADQHKIQLPMEAKVADTEAGALNYAGISRFYVDTMYGEAYLTRREYDCLSLWFCGKTAKQIGPILGTSFRTVESHLENVKGKLNIQYKDQLFSQLQFLGLFEALVKNGLRLFRGYESCLNQRQHQ